MSETTDTTEAVVPSEVIEFGGLQIGFDERVLRPRTWTAAQSWWSASLLADLVDGAVLELCCGAGQIGLLAVRQSTRRLVCVDLNPVATAYTRHNAAAAGLDERVSVRTARISESVGDDERFALVIADPPWVPHDETSRFPQDPPLAIDGGDDGLSVTRECLEVIKGHLSPGGVTVLQLGNSAQVAAVAALLADSDLVPGEVREYGDHGVLLRLDRPA